MRLCLFSLPLLINICLTTKRDQMPDLISSRLQCRQGRRKKKIRIKTTASRRQGTKRGKKDKDPEEQPGFFSFLNVSISVSFLSTLSLSLSLFFHSVSISVSFFSTLSLSLSLRPISFSAFSSALHLFSLFSYFLRGLGGGRGGGGGGGG